MLEKRGRKSAEDRAAEVIPLELPDSRPPPPADLSPRAQEAWRDATAVLPAGSLGPETWPALRGYCHHLVAADLAWLMYSAALADPNTPTKKLDRLSRLFNRESDGVRRGAKNLGLCRVMRRGRGVPRYAVTPPAPWNG